MNALCAACSEPTGDSVIVRGLEDERGTVTVGRCCLDVVLRRMTLRPASPDIVLCDDYHAHQTSHRHLGGGRWRCDNCSAAPAE
jgi:hypothetical protein